MVGTHNALVVAHPDDETLWGAGIMLRHPGDWTVICCSIPRRDPIRAWKFFDACTVLGAKPRLLPFTEAEPTESLMGLSTIDLSRFDCIVTHNHAGEYGHLHHKQVAAMIPKAIRFGEGVGGQPLELTAAESGKKLQALKCYDHVLPYGGRKIPKWEALLERYGAHLLHTESYA
jgi:LmbE family N-acetylglucosaminyl deacetylase